jgi:tetratricopeptide (TPR) repeat protein
MPRLGLLPAALSLALLATPALAQQVTLSVPIDTLVARARRDSTDPLVLYDLGMGYWYTRKFGQADSAFRRADAIDPRVAEVQLALAYLPYARRPKLWGEEAKGKVPAELVATVNESNRRFRRAFLLDPMVDMRVMGLVVPPRDAIVINFNADRYYAALVVGLEYFWGGDYPSAYASFEKAYQFASGKDRDEIPGFVLWYHGLAAAHINEYDTAVGDFRRLLARALEREKSDSVTRFAILQSNSIRYVLATMLRRAGQQDQASEEFRTVLSTDLSFEMAHSQLAEIAEKSHRWSDAVQERERALEASPDDPGLLLDYGTTLLSARRYQDATAALLRAEQAMPLNARVPYLMGQAAAADGRTDEAIKAYRRFVAIAPDRFWQQVNQLEAKYPGLRAN